MNPQNPHIYDEDEEEDDDEDERASRDRAPRGVFLRFVWCRGITYQ
jgi:hypothetical protein